MKKRFLVTALSLLFLIFLLYGGCSGMGAAVEPTTPDDENAGDFGIGMRDASGLDQVPMIIKAAPNTVKIKRGADVSNFAEKVSIRGSRNEHEPFQIIPIPSGLMLTDVQVGVSDLFSEGGDFFSRENFSYYLEAYVFCNTPSDSGGDSGWFPDPLVPITDPFTIDKSLGNQPIWIDCYIPYGTPPGVYSGNVIVSAAGGVICNIPIRLKVLDFTLDETFKLKTAFGLHRECINAYHGYPDGYNSVEVDELRAEYADVLLDRGVSFWGFDFFKPLFRVNGDDTVTVDFTPIEDRFDEYFNGPYHMTTFQFPLRAWDLLEGSMTADTYPGSPVWRKRVQSYIEECAKYYESRGILDRGFVFVIDEPNSATEYSNIRYIAQLVREVIPHPKFMVTEQAYSSNYEDWGSLLGYVDIFCPLLSLVEPNGDVDADDPFNMGAYEYETWIYTNTNVAPYPGYAIDHPSLEPRLLAWLCYEKGFTGMLYWSANYWKLANPWEDPYTLGSPIYGAGNGCLLYPGMDINEYTGQADQVAPVSSIRLEEIREGLEDYEYLMAIGGGNEIPEINMVISDYDDYMVDGKLFYKLRNIGTEFFFGGK